MVDKEGKTINIETEAELYKRANKMIENIYKFKREYAEDLSILDTIIEYSRVSSIPLQEIGNTLADHKDFIKIFKKQLVRDKYFKDDSKENIDILLEEDEW